jgi:tetratricopeptide (TPR) repeat protein
MLAAFLSALKGSARQTSEPVGRGAMRDSVLPSPATERISAEQQLARGNLLLKDGLLGEAADCYRDAIVVEPDLGDAHLNLGFVLVEQELFDQALPALQRALEIKPTSSDAHYLLGTLHSRLGSVGAAIRHFENAIAWKPDFVLA